MISSFIIAHVVIIATSLWAIFSERINDGLVGRLALAGMCCACVANIGWAVADPATVDRSDAAFAITVAVMAVRCYGIKHHAIRIRRWIRSKRT